MLKYPWPNKALKQPFTKSTSAGKPESNGTQEFRRRIKSTADRWIKTGLPSRQEMETEAAFLNSWKHQNRITGLWAASPLMMTTTLDDGLGQGLEVIELFGSVAGLQVIPLGLLQKPFTVIEACRRHCPDILGMTVLQLDSEDMLTTIGSRLPDITRFVAGGPVFRFDPDLAARCGIVYVAPNVAFFLRYLLKLHL